MNKFKEIINNTSLHEERIKNSKEINEVNKKTLTFFCFCSLIIFIMFAILESVSNIFTLPNHVFIVAALMFFIIIVCNTYIKQIKTWVLRSLIFSLIILSLLFAIYVDVILKNNQQTSLFYIYLILFSIVFIENPLIIYGLSVTFFGLYNVSTYCFLDISTFYYNLAISSVVLVISILLNKHICAGRIKDIDIKRKLKISSDIDELTEMFNRRSFNEYNKKNQKEFISTVGDISIIMFDIDYFKNYNDTYGHLLGDECLKIVANILIEESLAKNFYVARYGGEEFVAVLKSRNLKQTKEIATNIVKKIKALKIEHKTSTLGYVTISAGCSSKQDDEIYDAYKLLNYADHNLYKAKVAGKNCVK